MNESAETLRNLIHGARRGRESAVTVLRSIVRLSADQAPSNDIINIAQFLYDQRVDDQRKLVEQN